MFSAYYNFIVSVYCLVNAIQFYMQQLDLIITHACMARDFNFLYLCYVNYSNFHGTIMTCTVYLFIK